MPKITRKQLTYCVIYKPKNVAEFESISKELFNMNKDDSLVYLIIVLIKYIII